MVLWITYVHGIVDPLMSQRGDNPYFLFDVILCQSMVQNTWYTVEKCQSYSCTFWNYSVYEGRDLFTSTMKWIHAVFWFLTHLSWKLKWVFLIFSCPSPVSPSDCLSGNFSHFHLLLQNHSTNLNQTWRKAFFW